MAFSTMLLVMFGVIFWIFRIAIAIVTQTGFDLIGLVSWNLTYEIILIFVTIVCLILISKKKLIGSIVYLFSYLLYFGTDILNRVATGTETVGMTMENTVNVFVSAIGIVLATAILLDAIVLKARKGKPKKQKTDWFYGNENFDRQFDERADRNEYKF
ncbi:MAG: hypothetical protein HFJ49_01620 [Clostridia bacterium]|nr:hypothetical protein [Clostridia bacterium]